MIAIKIKKSQTNQTKLLDHLLKMGPCYMTRYEVLIAKQQEHKKHKFYLVEELKILFNYNEERNYNNIVLLHNSNL